MSKKEKKIKEKVITEYTCQYCGKKFTAEGRFRRKWCSDECRKAYISEYNSKYIKTRRKTDEEFAKKSREWANRTSIKAYANSKWNNCLDHAEAITKLSKMADAKNLIAKYLDQNFIARASGYKERTYKNADEAKAQDVLESLGDEFLTSN